MLAFATRSGPAFSAGHDGMGAMARPHHHDPGGEMAGMSDMSGTAAATKYTAARANYTVPAVTLTDAHGRPVRLAQLLSQPRPVLVQFIFTSCTTICPLLSTTFSQAQAELGRMHGDYQLISISIDPEYDTPERLAAYAKRYNAGAHWMFLTGQAGDVRSVMTAFDALYQGSNKMYHRPLFYLRARPDTPWLRIEGFMQTADLLREYHGVLGAAGLAVR
ncbi:MAG: SCO family protein [Gammaproteobacteria bacterium]|nr:SCO family protein [Gammaproteobacteria bacterium]